MVHKITVFVALCLGVTGSMAQMMGGMGMMGGLAPLMFGGGEMGEMFEGGGGMSFYLFQTLQNEIQSLKAGVMTGAIGGCDSGVVGPVNSLNPVVPITFQRKFFTSPTVTVAVSGFQAANPAVPISLRAAVTNVSPTGAIVTFQGGTPPNINAASVSYMACPGRPHGD